MYNFNRDAREHPNPKIDGFFEELYRRCGLDASEKRIPREAFDSVHVLKLVHEYFSVIARVTPTTVLPAITDDEYLALWHCGITNTDELREVLRDHEIVRLFNTMFTGGSEGMILAKSLAERLNTRQAAWN